MEILKLQTQFNAHTVRSECCNICLHPDCFTYYHSWMKGRLLKKIYNYVCIVLVQNFSFQFVIVIHTVWYTLENL